MTIPASHSMSILPKDRDHRFNGLLDWACDTYRNLAPGETITEYGVKVINGQGHAELIVKDKHGLRRITISDERVDVTVLGGEPAPRGEAALCQESVSGFWSASALAVKRLIVARSR